MADQSTLHALLIGIDCYMPRTIDGLPFYNHLGGCVGDIELMEEFLTTRLAGPKVRVTKLTASGKGKQPKESPETWPTKANIVAAFRQLAGDVKAGEQVYIHYAGHGGRAVTLYPKTKGDEGLDESLVPTDYGQIENQAEPEDRYLRDLEIAALLQALVEKQAVVTLVLDSCHSGGASRGIGDERGDGPSVRGSGEVDRVPRTPVEWVASPAELMAGWEEQSRGTRSMDVAAGWQPNPNGYTLLAACRALELATEASMPNGKRHGYLTYYLWDALQKPMRNWEMVHQQVASRVKGRNRSQTPQLQGAGNRAVFGGADVSLPVGVNVLKVEGDRLQLDIGRSGGVAVGAQFFVYPSGLDNFKEPTTRLAVVEVTESNNGDSWATILRRLKSDAVEPGAQALLFDPGPGQQGSVLLVLEGAAPADVENAALESLAVLLDESERRFVHLAAEGEPAHFIVAVTDDNRYEIRDSLGHPIPNLPPSRLDNPGEVLYQLIHLTKYLTVLALNNPDPVSSLGNNLDVTLMETLDKPFPASEGTPTVISGEQIYYLRIRNLFQPLPGPPNDSAAYIEGTRRRTLNITALNLSPEWEISRIIPFQGEAANQIELGPGETLLLPRYDLPGEPLQLPAFQSSLPAGVPEAEDIIKVFATTETVNSYDSLQLPPIAEMGKRASLIGPKPQEPEQRWGAAQISVRVTRG